MKSNKDYPILLENIGAVLDKGRQSAIVSVNSILIQTYWNIGQSIVEYEQQGNEKAEYGSKLLDTLSRDLNMRYGKGFSKSNIYTMRLMYLKYPKFQTASGKLQTVSAKLSWSHYVELLTIADDLERGFYEKQSINEHWSVRELKRQIDSALFERISLGKDKREVLELSNKGQIIKRPEDIIKDPYVFEFLGLSENNYSEKELEQALIDNLKTFILELGRGFTFVQRQYRITINNEHYYIDLVFYHRILKCFVLIDLKLGKVKPQDVGQMNMYLNYFHKEEGSAIGIILSRHNDELMIKYALGGISNKLFISKYKIYLPTVQELSEIL
ncbi:MAG: PDDEXK nuclease domain-containing protein [Candidatus Woesearchaeota archaeon]